MAMQVEQAEPKPVQKRVDDKPAYLEFQSRIIRRKNAARYINVSLATLYRIMRNDPEFPPVISLSPNCRGFDLAALDRWLAGRAGK